MNRKRLWILGIATGLALGMSGCGSDTTGSAAGAAAKQTNEEQQKEDVQQAASEFEETIENTAENTGVSVVYGGYQITLPEYVEPQITEQGLILTDEDMSYQMLCVVTDKSFDDRVKAPDVFMQGVVNAGLTITKEVEVTTVDGREYAYFNYEDDGDNMLLAYSKADDNHTFANQVVRYGEQSDEEVLKEIGRILATAKQTEAADTTADDLAYTNASDLDGAASYGTQIETAEFTLNGIELSMKVPQEFLWVELDEESDRYSKSFISLDGLTNVMYMAVDDMGYDSAEEWVTDAFVSSDALHVSKSEVMSQEVDGREVWYQIISYDYEMDYKDETVSYIALNAICKMQDGCYLQMQAETTKTAGLNFDTVKDFFVEE